MQSVSTFETVCHCMWCDIPCLFSPFLNTASNQNLTLEKAWEPGCAFCLLLTSLLPRLCRLPLRQTPTVVPIPGSLLLLLECLDTITLDSQADQDLDQQRHSAGSSAKICAPWLAFSRAKGRSATELEEARIQCTGCLCTLGCKGGFSTTRT